MGKEGGQSNSFIKMPLFWLLIVVMLCAGASEMAMGQWASTFAETALHGNKTLGDLMGPFFFAVLMGSSRVLYAKFSTRISLRKIMIAGSVICILCYLVAALAPHPIVALIGCGLCGLAVGIMWPGGISIAAGTVPQGGVSMFALLALAGDIGCLTGPTVVGNLTEALSGDIRLSFLFALVFPLLLILSLICLSIYKKKKSK